MELSVILLGFAAGLSIGIAGVGGVIQVPVLTYILGYDQATAIASSSFSFLFVSAAGTGAYARRGTIPWKTVWWVAIGLGPAAMLGAWAESVVPEFVPALALALLLLIAGVDALRRRLQVENDKVPVRKVQLIVVGSLVGFGSALTGTGGPVLLVPLLLWLRLPALLAIGASQAAQIPIAIAASAGYFAFGTIDYALGASLGVAQMLGAAVGASLAHLFRVATLRTVIGMALMLAGLLVAGRTLL